MTPTNEDAAWATVVKVLFALVVTYLYYGSEIGFDPPLLEVGS